MTAWTDHVKKCAKEKGLSYRQAMKDPSCSASYHAGKPAKPEKAAMKGASKRSYMKGDAAKEALLKFQEAKMKRKAKKSLIGMSPEPNFGVTLGY